MPTPLATVPGTAAHTVTSRTGEARHCSAGFATSGAWTSGSTSNTYQSSRLSGAENTWLFAHLMQTDSAAAGHVSAANLISDRHVDEAGGTRVSPRGSERIGQPTGRAGPPTRAHLSCHGRITGDADARS